MGLRCAQSCLLLTGNVCVYSAAPVLDLIRAFPADPLVSGLCFPIAYIWNQKQTTNWYWFILSARTLTWLVLFGFADWFQELLAVCRQHKLNSNFREEKVNLSTKLLFSTCQLSYVMTERFLLQKQTFSAEFLQYSPGFWLPIFFFFSRQLFTRKCFSEACIYIKLQTCHFIAFWDYRKTCYIGL